MRRGLAFIGAVAAMSVVIAGSVGCGGKKEAAEPIKIGAVFSVSGAAAKLGGPEKNAALMIVDEINKAGGVNGRQIELIVEDDQGVEENTVNAIQKLITSDNVVAIIGPTRSGNALVAAPICEEAGVPLVSCAATLGQLYPEKDITKPPFRFVFKTPQNDSDCAVKILDDCKAKGFTKVALVTGTDAFGAAGRAELVKLAPEYGVTIVADETYPPDATDLTPILTKIKAQKPQAVVNWSIVAAQGLVAGQISQIGLKTQLYQSHGFGNKEYITPEAEGVLFPAGRLLAVDSMDSTDIQYPVLKKFRDDYQALYGEDVSTFAGHAYDSLWLTVKAIEKAQSTDRLAIRDALETLGEFVGTAGVFRMTPTDHCGIGLDAFAMLTVKDGSFALAATPAPQAK